MDSALTTVGLPIALAIVMFGLGLGLTSDDFRRVAKHPKAVAVALPASWSCCRWSASASWCSPTCRRCSGSG